jgi:phosphoserine phosphatase RsbU/P
MFNKSIAYRLSVFISLAVISVFVAFIVANYLFNRKILRQNSENKAITLSSEVNSIINGKIITTKEISGNLAEEIIYYSKNGDAGMILERVMQKYPYLNAVHVQIDSSVILEYHNYYIFQKDSGFEFEQSKTPVYYCQKEKELLEQIINSEEPGWTEPYRCREKGNVVVSYYTPVVYNPEENNRRFAGKIISELSLTELNESLNQMEIGERGYAFLITKKGDYITHPNESWILKQNAYLLPSKSLDPQKVDLNDILQNNRTGSAVVYPEILNFEKSWVYYTPINENRWFLILIIPYKELFHELYSNTFRMLFFASLGIIFIFLIIKYISRKIIDPLSDVTSKLTAFSNYATGEKVTTKDEVKLVANSLEYLKAWFEEYRVSREEEEMQSLRRKQDLQQAIEIQQSLIKTNFPAFPNRRDIDLYAVYKPARGVSGDLFDYFFIDDDHLLFTIGDVSGKGIPAAIFMSVAQTIIKNNASSKKVKRIVNKSNMELCTTNRHQYFLTLILGIINMKTGELNFCNAAHNFPYLLKQDGKISELKLYHGLPLGLYPDKKYKDAKIQLNRGDSIILYTDGVTELRNDRKIQFGSERLKENLAKLEGLQPAKMVELLDKKLEFFRGNASQEDDICLFVIKYLP